MFRIQRISIIVASMLILLVCGLWLGDQFTCSFTNNMFGLNLAKGDDAQAEQTLDMLKTCPQSCYFRTVWYLQQKRLQEALDIWQTCGAVSYHAHNLLPVFFQTGIAAHQASTQQDWDESLITYRRMFYQSDMDWSLRFHLQNPRFDDIPEYQQSLLHWYASRSNHLDATELLRYGLWLWRAGDFNKARIVLDQALNKNSSTELKKHISAYRLLIEADTLSSQQYITQATEIYTQIPREEKAPLARALVKLAQMEKQVSQHSLPMDWRALLSTWNPSLTISYTLASQQAQLKGVEILEPDLIGDGGNVCVLLFWHVSSSAIGEIIPENWLFVQNGLYIEERCTRNLIRDPGFEWNNTLRDGTISNWYNDLYGESGNRPYAEIGTVDGSKSRFVCLNNPSEGKRRSGIIQHGLAVKSTECFLLLARMVITNGAEGGLRGAWVIQNTRNYFYAAMLKDNPNDWTWIGSVITPYSEDSNMQVYVVNYETIGKVCVDDLVLIKLSR